MSHYKSFEEWMGKVDNIFRLLSGGVSIYDTGFEEYRFESDYEAELYPRESLENAILFWSIDSSSMPSAKGDKLIKKLQGS